ncbi:hypothetical protein [Streptomyces sp. NPDC048606]|uniref:hypothetical protein n=1 Tax=Streptomyces sp. NPDC048606 TaxID=3154726 RepID=UPI0034154002
MAARREKVSRWESGRTVPDLGTQLAIAHVHQVGAEDVHRLGWPHWLYLATDAAALAQPWTAQGAVNAARQTAQPNREGVRSYLTVTGTLLEAQEAEASLSPMTLYRAARAEDRLVLRLLAAAGYDRPTGTRLLLLATRTATRCGCFSRCLGDEAGAERYALAALRTGNTAGSQTSTANTLLHTGPRSVGAPCCRTSPVTSNRRPSGQRNDHR